MVLKDNLQLLILHNKNGVAERKNRTIMNMVRSMMLEKKIPKEFWPEAVNWYVYVQNRSPTIDVKDITPEEAWSGIKPSVHFFRVFGCMKIINTIIPSCNVHVQTVV